MLETQVVEKILKNTISGRNEWGHICFTIHTETFEYKHDIYFTVKLL